MWSRARGWRCPCVGVSVYVCGHMHEVEVPMCRLIWVWLANLGLLEEQHMLLTPELSL